MRQPDPPRPSLVHVAPWSARSTLIPLSILAVITMAVIVVASRLTLFETIVLPFLDKPVFHEVDCRGSSWPVAKDETRREAECGLLYYRSRAARGSLLKVPIVSSGPAQSGVSVLALVNTGEGDSWALKTALAEGVLAPGDAAGLGVAVLHLGHAKRIKGGFEQAFDVAGAMGPNELGSFGEALGKIEEESGIESWVVWANASAGELATRFAAENPERTKLVILEGRGAWTAPWGRFEKPTPIVAPTLLIDTGDPPINLSYLFATVLSRFKDSRVRLLVAGKDDDASQRCFAALLSTYVSDELDGPVSDCAGDVAIANVSFN